ncbi:MAG: hypothetical protein ABL925_00835 [Methylococcales bacterium]
MKIYFTILMTITLLLDMNLVSAAIYENSVIELPLKTPKLNTLTSDIPAARGNIQVNLQIAYGDNGKLSCTNVSTIEENIAVCNGLQKGRNYTLTVSSSASNTRLKLTGVVTANHANAIYKGSKGKLKSNKVSVDVSYAESVNSSLSLRQVTDNKGKITGTAQLTSGYTESTYESKITGSIKRGKVFWTLKNSAGKLTFNGKYINNQWTGKLSGSISPAKVSLSAISVLNCIDDCKNNNNPVTSKISGRLWHEDYALDYTDGTQIAFLSGDLPAVVSPKHYAYPWPDGNQYIIADANVYDDYTELTVYNTGTGNLIFKDSLDGYVRSVKPSPVSKQVLLFTWGRDLLDDPVYVFYDLATKEILKATTANDSLIDWLPNGQYLRISPAGAIYTGGLASGAQEQQIGQIAIPFDRKVWGLSVNPQGTQIIVQLVVLSIDQKISDSDLWIANLDGTNLARVTRTNMTHSASWSPDGQHIAFDRDTGMYCSGWYCAGSCSLWYVPISARDIVAVPAAKDAEVFTVKNRQGDARTLGCDLLGWTP